jgi:hypothetical protein
VKSFESAYDKDWVYVASANLVVSCRLHADNSLAVFKDKLLTSVMTLIAYTQKLDIVFVVEFYFEQAFITLTTKHYHPFDGCANWVNAEFVELLAIKWQV